MKKWYQDWVEVFKSGVHTDSKGITRTWSEQDLDAIVQSYDPSQNEAPLVIGHPATDAPAFGWVEQVKREKDRLLVKFKKIVPEFVKWVDKGLYRKISVAINKDNTLRHVGFLGAAPPAIKGLQHSFSSDDSYFYYENKDKEERLPKESHEFAALKRDYDELLTECKRLEARNFITALCHEGKINSAYAGFLEDTICTLESAPSNTFTQCDENPAELMREFLKGLSPRCTFGEIATQGPKRPLTRETEMGLRIAKSLQP